MVRRHFRQRTDARSAHTRKLRRLAQPTRRHRADRGALPPCASHESIWALSYLEPWTLLGQQPGDDPHCSFAAALFDFPVVRSDPAANLAAYYVPACVVLKISTHTLLLPSSSSFRQHQSKKRVVMALTQRPSTNRSQLSL